MAKILMPFANAIGLECYQVEFREGRLIIRGYYVRADLGFHSEIVLMYSDYRAESFRVCNEILDTKDRHPNYERIAQQYARADPPITATVRCGKARAIIHTTRIQVVNQYLASIEISYQFLRYHELFHQHKWRLIDLAHSACRNYYSHIVLIWCQCARRLGLYKDIRIYIGKILMKTLRADDLIIPKEIINRAKARVKFRSS